MDQVLAIPSRKYRTRNGKALAATKIQATWKMFRAVRELRYIKLMIKQTTILQTSFRVYRRHQVMKARLAQKEVESNEHVRHMVEGLKESWASQVSRQHRVEVHVSSFTFDEWKRMTMENMVQRENL